MKRTAEIVGLPIFSLLDGTEIGRVKQLVIQPNAGCVAHMLVENEWDAIGVHVLPYASVVGVGEYAVTVESRQAIQEHAQVEGARDLILLGYQVIGTRVLSRKGQLIGEVNEYYVDEETGHVAACSFVEAKNVDSTKVFAKDNIMTFGRDVIVIHSEDKIYSSLDEQQSTITETEEPAVVEANTSEQAEAADTLVTASQEIAATTAAPLAVGPYAYLVGKSVNEDLRNEAGELLATAGTLITHELIERIKADSPTLFMKLNRLASDK